MDGHPIAGQTPIRAQHPNEIPKDDPFHQPTKAEMEEGVSIPDSTPEELPLAVVGKHPRRVTH